MHYNTTLNSIADFSDQWQLEDIKPLGEKEGTFDDDEDDDLEDGLDIFGDDEDEDDYDLEEDELLDDEDAEDEEDDQDD